MVGNFFKSKKNKSDNLETIAFTNDNVVNENFIKKLNLDSDTRVKDTKILKIDALNTKNISINSQGNPVEIAGKQFTKNFDCAKMRLFRVKYILVTIKQIWIMPTFVGICP